MLLRNCFEVLGVLETRLCVPKRWSLYVERKCPNSLGAYLLFPEVTFAVSVKIPGETLSRTRQKEREQVQHHSSAAALLPKEQRTTMFTTSEQRSMFLIFFSDGQMEYKLLFKENSISQGYFVVYMANRPNLHCTL